MNKIEQSNQSIIVNDKWLFCSLDLHSRKCKVRFDSIQIFDKIGSVFPNQHFGQRQSFWKH